MDIKKELPGVRQNISLAPYTTFKIGGKAKYFFVARTKADLLSAVKTAKKKKMPFFILGGGSNLLVSDKGFNGLLIKAGKPLPLYVSRGLEWAAGIPGTVEGAIFGNAGAFGKSMEDAVKEVEIFDSKTGKIKILGNKDCRFGYKESIFKKKKNLIILSVKIKTRKSNPREIKRYLAYRKETQPLSLPSAGSIFKNPQEFSAGFLIEKCGLKGKRIAEVKISEKHANFIVNLGKGRARDVKKLINLAKREVKKKFRIKLEEEIQYLGF